MSFPMSSGGASTASVTITAALLQSKLDGVTAIYINLPATPAMVIRGFYATGALFEHEDSQPLTLICGTADDNDAAFTAQNICTNGTPPASPLTPGVAGAFGGAFGAMGAGTLRLRVSSPVNLNQYTEGPVTVTLFYDALPGAPFGD